MDGTPYAVVVRLSEVAQAYWPDIEADYYEIRLLRRPAPTFFNLVYRWLKERVPKEKLQSFDHDLKDLLPWQDSSSPEAEALEAESFFATHNQNG